MAEAQKKSGNKFVKFFKEVKSEMKKVAWPSRKQVTNNTLIVMAVVILVGLFVWILDTAFQFGLFQFITK